MILEIGYVEVLPENHSRFESAVNTAVRDVLMGAKGFKDFTLHKGIEESNTYAFLIYWETLEDHTVEFRGSDQFKRWRELIGPFFLKPSKVTHWSRIT